jgi:hypothetical protein
MTFAQLTGMQNFGGVCGGIRDRGSVSGGLFSEFASTFGDTVTIASDRTGPSYRLCSVSQSPDDVFDLSFDQSNRDTTPNTERYTRVGANGFTDRFSVFIPTSGGTPLDYLRIGTITTRPGSNTLTNFCAFGVPTIVTDVPASTVTYRNAGIIGNLSLIENDGAGARSNYVMTPTLTVVQANPATGRITFNLTLNGRLVTGSTVSDTDTQFGSFMGEATVEADGGYSATLFDGSNTATGNFAGGFFGPQGREGALTFSIMRTDSSNRRVVVGAVAILVPDS